MKLQSMEEIKKNLDHMDLGELIRGGYFNNRIIYPTREEYEIMKVCEHCHSRYKDVDAAQKFAEAQHRYQQEEGRLYNLFKETLFYEFKVENAPKAEKAFSIAWDRGHASGFYDVYLNFQNLVELII